MVRFQLSPLISFGLRKFYHMRVVDLHLPKLIEGDISLIFDRIVSIKYLSITKGLVDTKLLAFGKFLADCKHLIVSKFQ